MLVELTNQYDTKVAINPAYVREIYGGGKLTTILLHGSDETLSVQEDYETVTQEVSACLSHNRT